MQKKIYYNSNKDIWYLEGDTLTYRVNSYYVFSGIPTEELLLSWGFELNPGPIPSPTITVDTLLDIHSDNPIANRAVATALNSKEGIVEIVAPVNTTDATLPITALNTETSKYYRIDVAVETLAITLPAMTDSTKIANVVLMLTGGTSPAVTIASTAPSGGTAPDVYYQDGFAIETGKNYEVNCLYNGAAWVVAAVEIIIS